jgi:AFG3 family protein
MQIDVEAKNMVDEMYVRTTELLNERSTEMAALAEELLLKETVNHDDLVRILGPRPFKASDAYEQYVNMTMEQVNDDDAEEKDVAEETSSSDDDSGVAGEVKPTFAATTTPPSSRSE